MVGRWRMDGDLPGDCRDVRIVLVMVESRQL